MRASRRGTAGHGDRAVSDGAASDGAVCDRAVSGSAVSDCAKSAVSGGAVSRRDRGQAALEYAGIVALLLFVAIAALQLGIAGYAIQQAGTGARAAARTATYRETEGDDYQAAGRDAISGWLAGGARFSASDSGSGVTVTARIHIPALVPLLDLGDATRTVTMPRDRLPDRSAGAHPYQYRSHPGPDHPSSPRPQSRPRIQVVTSHHTPGAAP